MVFPLLRLQFCPSQSGLSNTRLAVDGLRIQQLLFEEYIAKIDIARDSPELLLGVPAAGSKK
jgi:hypothetical protein